jgi:lipopolysaccharide biosynthesis glycosyltransferase
MKNRNIIIVCATNDWLAPAAITLLSCAIHGAQNYSELIIVTPNPTPELIAQLEKFNRKHDIKIQMLGADIGELSKVNAGKFTIGTLLRLRLDHILPRNLNRVLYLDSDVLALNAMEEIFSIDLNGNAIAAAEDIAVLPWINRNGPEHLQQIGLATTSRYFNAGVLLFDWQKTLQEEILKTAYELMIGKIVYKYPDQDVLNIAANGRWKRLHPKWNLDKKIDGFLKINPIFRHYTGSVKPWTCWRVGFAGYRKFATDALTGTDWELFMKQKQSSVFQSFNFLFFMRKIAFTKQAKLKKHLKL